MEFSLFFLKLPMTRRLRVCRIVGGLYVVYLRSIAHKWRVETPLVAIFTWFRYSLRRSIFVIVNSGFFRKYIRFLKIGPFSVEKFMFSEFNETNRYSSKHFTESEKIFSFQKKIEKSFETIKKLICKCEKLSFFRLLVSTFFANLAFQGPKRY